MSEKTLEPQHDSSALWSQLSGKVDHQFKSTLEKLDTDQSEETISPYLAETVRHMFFQLASENPQRLQELSVRCNGSPKFILTNMEDGGGYYRLSKSAALIEKSTQIPKSQIIEEYREWMFEKADED